MDLDTGTRHFRTVLRWLIDELLRTHTGPIELLSYARPALTKLLSGRRLTAACDRSGRGPSGSRRRTWRERAQRIRLGRRRKPGIVFRLQVGKVVGNVKLTSQFVPWLQ